MRAKEVVAVFSLFWATGLSAGGLAADPPSLKTYDLWAGEGASFTLQPPGPQHRIHLALPEPRPATPEIRRGGSAPSGSRDGLRKLIGRVDAGPADYDAVQYAARIKPPKPPTRMTLAEIFRWIDATPGQHHAIGRYQFIPSTLERLVEEADLSRETMFSPPIQDMLADILLEDAGLSDFVAGRIDRHRFMENLARIWAAFPTASGRSHYHGIAGNRAVISWSEFDFQIRTIFPGRRG